MSVLKIKKNGQWVKVGTGAQGPIGPVGPAGPAGEGSGDMLASIYDPQGKAQDIFKYTDDKIAAIPTPDVSGQINTHNTSGTAHSDIRQAVSAAQSAAQSAATAANAAETNANKYTDQKIAAIPTPDVSGQIDSHNTDTAAHADIREAMPVILVKNW